MAPITADAVHLRASGVSLVVAVGDRRLPRVVHWGADVGEMDAPALSALAVLPEHSWGWMGTPGIAGHRDGRDHSTRFVASAVDLTTHGSGETAVQSLTVQAADAVADLALTVTLEMLASGLVRARATIGSTGAGSDGTGSRDTDEDAAPYTLDAMTVLLPVPPDAREIAGAPGSARAPFSLGTHSLESRRGTPGPGGGDLWATGTPGFGFRAGEVWATHVGWSGNARHLAERLSDGTGAIGGGEILFPGEVRLAPGETYASPWVYFSYGAGLDAATARVHRFLRSRAEHPAKPRPVMTTTADADFDIPSLTALADAAAAVDTELLVLGDGWSKGRRGADGGLGDWYVDKTLFPEGLRPFADYVRQLGMEFGLWFAPEMISPDSDLAREHPEWIAQASLAGASLRLPLEQRGQQVLDLTNPDAYLFVEERLNALVAELRPTFIVWEHGRDLIEAGSPTTGRAIGHRQTLAFYDLLDGLRRGFPGLEIEVSGGGRADLEVLQRVHRVHVEEGSEAPPLVPPERVGRTVSLRRGVRARRSLGARASAAFWGYLGFAWASAASPPEEDLALVRGWIELHKRHRKLLHGGTVVRSDAIAPGATLHGVVSRDRRDALFAYAPERGSRQDAGSLLRLDGLDPEAGVPRHARHDARRDGGGPRGVGGLVGGRRGRDGGDARGARASGSADRAFGVRSDSRGAGLGTRAGRAGRGGPYEEGEGAGVGRGRGVDHDVGHGLVDRGRIEVGVVRGRGTVRVLVSVLPVPRLPQRRLRPVRVDPAVGARSWPSTSRRMLRDSRCSTGRSRYPSRGGTGRDARRGSRGWP